MVRNSSFRGSMIALTLLSLASALTLLAVTRVSGASANPQPSVPFEGTPPMRTRVYLPLVLRAAPSQLYAPDLAIISVYNNMRGYHGGCVSEYDMLVVNVCVKNSGAGKAGAFSITVEGKEGARSAGLPAYATECLETVPSVYGFDEINVMVDSRSEIAESNEQDNTWSGILPIPTPPPTCPPTP